MTTGEKLATLRKRKGITQEQLAEILQVSRQSVSRWEMDAAFPETEKLVKLGKLLGCSIDFLLDENQGSHAGGLFPVHPGMRLFFPGHFRGRQAQAKAHGDDLCQRQGTVSGNG